MSKGKSVYVKQVSSPIGRKSYQRKCLIGLGLNKINRCKVLPYNDSILGMVNKVKHLVKFEIQDK